MDPQDKTIKYYDTKEQDEVLVIPDKSGTYTLIYAQLGTRYNASKEYVKANVVKADDLDDIANMLFDED